jgi:lysyl-tRNA synthetase, class II
VHRERRDPRPPRLRTRPRHRRRSDGSGLAAEKARRLARVDELRANGVSPYPYRFDRSHTVAEVRERWGDLEPGVETDDAVTIAGRVMLKRDSGKLVFATIRDRSGDLQLFVSKA